MTMNRVFKIPVGDLVKGHDMLYYSPLTGEKSFSVIIPSETENVSVRGLSDIRDLRKMSILPNNRCNFNCSYCYAAQGRDASELTIAKVDEALSFFVDRNRCDRPLSVAILGGGEPMLSKEVTFHAISQAKKLADTQGIRLELTLVTNASIVDDEMIDNILRHNVIVNASFDLLNDVQDIQRKDFLKVKDNIRKMCECGVYVTINSTITPLNVERMDEMVENAHMWFPEIEFMIFEPVIACQLFEDRKDLRNFYDNYIIGFFEARKLARKVGKDITCRIQKSLDTCQDRGCEGRFNVCPNGDITICYCTASPKDSKYAERKYGTVSETGVKIDQDKFSRICGENVDALKKCDDCFARFNCAGGCMLPNDSYSAEYLEEVCRFNREFIRRELVESLNKDI